jgi:hypothetical protein
MGGVSDTGTVQQRSTSVMKSLKSEEKPSCQSGSNGANPKGAVGLIARKR